MVETRSRGRRLVRWLTIESPVNGSEDDPAGSARSASPLRARDACPLPTQGSWRRKIGIGEATHRNPVDVAGPVALPKDVAACPFGQPVPLSGAAAIRAEMKAHLEAAVRVTLLTLARIPLSR